ncbi:MAG: aminopeptidase [Planctomycetes bacterium]|nr:aminopeptidase [Planctomycetota bacterium]
MRHSTPTRPPAHPLTRLLAHPLTGLLTHPNRRETMKIYISTDLEGISGVCIFEQTRERSSPLFEHARKLLMADIHAVVQGCLDGGAKEVVVMDGHGGGFNFVMDLAHPGATYVTGLERPHVMLGFDSTFSGVILLGFHAMNGTPTGILHHTQSSKSECKYWYNGRETGEIGQEAILTSHYQVPIIMVTGDQATCDEARQFLGDEIVTVAVKEGYSSQSGKLLAPARAHELLREGAARAMKQAPKCKPFKIDLPIEGKLQVKDKETADAMRPKRAQRLDDRTFVATFDSALDILRF